MIKANEVSNPNSCLNKAHEKELIFVIREADAAAADTIAFWIKRRMELGLNDEGDDKLYEAKKWIEQVGDRRKVSLTYYLSNM